MHIFLSAGEASGDQHGAHLMRELRRRCPHARFSGFGGPLMEQAGLESLHRLTDLAVIGVWAVLPLLWTFYKLVRRAGRYLEEHRPDAVVLIDFPGFNWWIARKAKRAGAQVFYYMPPQLWAWAPSRIRKVRRYVDHVLAALPFEADWYAQRGVSVEYVGHPFFDEVAEHRLDEAFCKALRAPLAEDRGSKIEDRASLSSILYPPSSTRVLALLPGSRNQEVRRNVPVMLRVVERIHARHPGLRFPVACYRESHRDAIRAMLTGRFAQLPLDLHVGRTSEIIDSADCCLMVSGSVSLELLARGKPAVVLYCGTVFTEIMVRLLVTCRFMSLPNLMVDRPIMPEFPIARNVETHVCRMAEILDDWLTNPTSLASARAEMQKLRATAARTGGIARAADAILRRLRPAVRSAAA
jgi:lipid-A-disaccharide synthase